MRAISSPLRGAFAAGLMALTMAACSGSAGASPTPVISPLANSDWLVTTIFGRDIPSGANLTLLFGVFQAGGFSGCNQFSTPYATHDTGLSFGPISSTRALCGPPLDAVETAYHTNLALVTRYQQTGDALTMTSGTGETVLAFTRMAPATVVGAWTITQVNNGSQGVSPPPTGVSASVSFDPDGAVSGFGGCNSFGGGYSQSGTDNISIGPLMSSLKACGDPADTFEGQLLTALQNATKWSVSAGALELRDAGGALQVGATAATQ